MTDDSKHRRRGILRGARTSTLVMLTVSLLISFYFAMHLFSASSSSASENLLSEQDLTTRINDLAGDDARLFRWDATRRTRYQQQFACDDLPIALKGIIDPKQAESWKWLAAEYATFCITNNPGHRATMASFGEPLHKAVVKMVQSKDPRVSAKASHLIYIGTYTNKTNHQGFLESDAISTLAKVLKDRPTPLQFMWSAIALGNLGASYCDDEEGGVGRCEWDWGQEDSLVVDGFVVSDAAAARVEMLNDRELIQVLVGQACKGPIKGRQSVTNPFPGSTAKAGEHDDNENIKTWAAAGALRNLAIAKEARDVLESAMPCFCRLMKSRDWLEKVKGRDCVLNQRITDPCWMERRRVTCVDRFFQDTQGNGCETIDTPDIDDECPNAIDKHGIAAKHACCICGGGDKQDQEVSE